MPGACPAEHEICFYIFIEAVLFSTTVEQIVKYTEDVYFCIMYEGWNFNSGNYLFTTDTK